MNAIAKKRGDNWMADYKILLQDLDKDRVSIIENKNTDTNINKEKKLAWEDLEESFNAMTKGTWRSVSQLKTQWAIIKMNAKKANAAHRKEIFKTGGGPRPTTPTERSDIYSWLPNEFITDVNNFDSDANISVCPDRPDGNLFVTDVSNKDLQDNLNKLLGGSQEVVAEITEDFPIQSQSNTPMAKKKLKLKSKPNVESTTAVTTTAKESITNIETLEVNCKKELHVLQIANEKKRGRNLDLEYKLLKIKLQSAKRRRI